MDKLASLNEPSVGRRGELIYCMGRHLCLHAQDVLIPPASGPSAGSAASSGWRWPGQLSSAWIQLTGPDLVTQRAGVAMLISHDVRDTL